MQELRKLARYIVNLKTEDIPPAVNQAATYHILDTMSAAIGASTSKLIRSITDEILLCSGKDNTSTIWGMNKKAPLSSAILINGMMGHLLELDDVHTRSKTHIGVVVIPAAWGVAEWLGRSGNEFITAVVCGYEVMARIGEALGAVNHRQKGWHATGTAGTFGAAAACGKLLNLTEDEMVWAFGLAGTQSSGLWAFLQDGANCKILHPGRASSNGFEAALLAKGGMTGPESILTATDGGMLSAMSDDYNVEKIVESLGNQWSILEMDSKPYPCCRSTHCAIDAAIALRNEIQLAPEQISRVEIATFDIGWKQCGLSKGSLNPQTTLEAKFSTPYTVAVALLYGCVGLQDFEEDRIKNRSIIDLMNKVSVVSDDDFSAAYPNHWGCRLTIETIQGKRLTKTINDASGSFLNPFTEQQQIQKAKQVLEYGGYQNNNKIISNLLKLNELKILPEV